MPKGTDPVPDWKDEKCSRAAAEFAKRNVESARTSVVRGIDKGAMLGLLASAFDAGRRHELGS